MTNIVLFLATLAGYSGLWFYIARPKTLKSRFASMGLIALLSMPFNINGNVFTVLGNAVSQKSVYSIFSLYQQAGGNAVNGVGIAYQQAGGDAVNGVGIAYQQASGNAGNGVGIVIYQKAGNSAKTNFSVAIYQKVREKSQSFAVWSTLTKD